MRTPELRGEGGDRRGRDPSPLLVSVKRSEGMSVDGVSTVEGSEGVFEAVCCGGLDGRVSDELGSSDTDCWRPMRSLVPRRRREPTVTETGLGLGGG